MNTDTSKQVDLLRWWHQYQTQMLNHEADLIRNSVLQDMFAMRRQLEVSGQSEPHRQLATIKRLYTLLEQLSNRLDPPYLHDSLPLALQYAVQAWQPKLHLTLGLPHTWMPEPPEQNRLLIAFIENLLQQIATADHLPEWCHLSLQYQAGVKKLTFDAQYKELLPSAWALQVSRSLQPFLKTFQLFTHGDYTQSIQPQSVNWGLRWQPPAH